MNAKPKRRWYQFSLGTLLLLLTAACLVAWWDPFGFRPPPPVPIETVPWGTTARVDVIELNEHYDAAGRTIFEQVIFWSRYPDGQLHARAWGLMGTQRTRMRLDHFSRGRCACSWTIDGITHRVEAPTFRRSKTLADLEMLDRNSLAKQDRQPLWERPVEDAQQSGVVSLGSGGRGPGVGASRRPVAAFRGAM